jgi:hypothetical protein
MQWYESAKQKIAEAPDCECQHKAQEHWHSGDDGMGGFANIDRCSRCRCDQYQAKAEARKE